MSSDNERGRECVRYVSFWETAPGQSMPPYIALALVSIKKALGDQFLLLTPQTVQDFIDPRILNRHWGFERLSFALGEGIESIVAKSDFIRMAFVYQHGGVWIDADSIFFHDPTNVLFPSGLSAKLHWLSECLFASRAGNALLAEALNVGLAEGRHAWGNPGGIKDIVARRGQELVPISPKVIDPGYRPLYNFNSCDVMHRRDIAASDFRLNDVPMVKLYNTYFKRIANRNESVAEFLAGGTLMAKLFLHIEPDQAYWVGETARLIEQCEQ